MYYFEVIRNFVFTLAYPVSMVGACFFTLGTLVNYDPTSIIVNKNMSFVVNGYIGICGLLSLFYWFNTDIPVVGTFILPNRNVIKSKVT